MSENKTDALVQQTDKFSSNFTALRLIIEEYKILKLNIGAEVGVLMGNTSAYLLKHFPDLKLLCIDPYKSYDEIGEERSQKAMDYYDQVAGWQLGEFGERAHRLKATSLEVAASMRDGGLDFVFIDASHEYPDVKLDIAAWYPKIRPGGLFSGHDYRWPGVKRAVDEFAENGKLSGLFTGADSDVWFFIKTV